MNIHLSSRQGILILVFPMIRFVKFRQMKPPCAIIAKSNLERKLMWYSSQLVLLILGVGRGGSRGRSALRRRKWPYSRWKKWWQAVLQRERRSVRWGEEESPSVEECLGHSPYSLGRHFLEEGRTAGVWDGEPEINVIEVWFWSS